MHTQKPSKPKLKSTKQKAAKLQPDQNDTQLKPNNQPGNPLKHKNQFQQTPETILHNQPSKTPKQQLNKTKPSNNKSQKPNHHHQSKATRSKTNTKAHQTQKQKTKQNHQKTKSQGTPPHTKPTQQNQKVKLTKHVTQNSKHQANNNHSNKHKAKYQTKLKKPFKPANFQIANNPKTLSYTIPAKTNHPEKPNHHNTKEVIRKYQIIQNQPTNKS